MNNVKQIYRVDKSGNLAQAISEITAPKLLLLMSNNEQFEQHVEELERHFPGVPSIGCIGGSYGGQTVVADNGVAVIAMEGNLSVVTNVLEQASTMPVKYIGRLEEDINKVAASEIAYLTKLRNTIQYLGASDCKLQEGSMRADVNLSVREKGSTEFGTRTETKNLNSFSAIQRAIEAETARQIDIIEAGGQVVQETRRWNDDKEYSYAMRSKEDAQDYRYFPDPDLVPIHISEEWLDTIREAQPEFKDEKMLRYKEEFGIPDYDINMITDSKKLADIFEETKESI